jgi:hypothetical protein
MANQPAPTDAAPMSDAEIKLRAAHEGEVAQVILTARRDLLARVQVLKEQQAAERAAFRVAEKAGVPFVRAGAAPAAPAAKSTAKAGAKKPK